MEIVAGDLKRHGFRKQRSSWYRNGSDLRQIINLQKSLYGPQFYVNIGWMPDGLHPGTPPLQPAYRFPVRLRLERSLDGELLDVEQTFDLESAADDQGREKSIRSIIEAAVEILDSISSTDRLKSVIKTRSLRGLFVTLDARKRIGIED